MRIRPLRTTGLPDASLREFQRAILVDPDREAITCRLRALLRHVARRCHHALGDETLSKLARTLDSCADCDRESRVWIISGRSLVSSRKRQSGVHAEKYRRLAFGWASVRE